MSASRTPLDPDAIASAFVAACRAELTALKPGNVHVHAAGHGMEVAHFLNAADAAAEFVAEPALSFGMRVRAAVGNSMAAAGCNTNLGIILLCVPLAAAAMLDAGEASLAERMAHVLGGLDSSDAYHVFAAIRAANPGGLGRSETADVAAPPAIGLVEAMRLAAARDRIAAAYANRFRDLIEDHIPDLRRIEARAGEAEGVTRDDIVATLYMSLLSRFPDSHIRRKFGFEVASHVQRLARSARPSWHPLVRPQAYPALLALDTLLKENGWNPGTSADFTVATLFASDLAQRGGFSLLSNVAS
ncbi:MAG: triphosphoribosyl-dephospho-CoA synthase [Hyphomicrobiaceae bacterium]|nr:triphosphoribosyl-dephospho-CoA synthase [Hyphomicrobiaceae bacterium]